MGLFNGSIRAKVMATLTAIGLSTALAAGSAGALTFATDSELVIKVPTTSACPTLTEQPRAYEAWFNVDDMEVRGYYDPLNQVPWDFPKKIAQILCGARQGAEIKIGMYFIRAIGTMSQPGLKAGADPIVFLHVELESAEEKRRAQHEQRVGDNGAGDGRFHQYVLAGL